MPTPTLMKPINLLKKGLEKLQNQTRERRELLNAALKANQCISEADEEWLDTGGNLVEEVCLVDKLDAVEDYEKAIEQLDSQEQSIVQRLTELAHGCALSKKRKCMYIFMFFFGS
ncbi:hypothetical protein J3R83DRAFT_3852 [Lanmaoa asiatica]|nr:hypothetical protein J3R83DRAFT_3852 [Lanmaoa asiatica]